MSRGLGVPGVLGVSHPGVGRLFPTLSRSRGYSSGVSWVSWRISKTIAHTSARTHPHPHARSGFPISPGHPGHPRGRGKKSGRRRFLKAVWVSYPGVGHPQDTPGQSPVGGGI
jgi:hypothetical protein